MTLLRSLIAAVVLLLALPCILTASPRGVVTVDASVRISPDRVVRPLHSTLFGVNVHPAIDKPLMSKPEFVERVKGMGIKSCRFPNGCVADTYNWRDPGGGQATVDEFLDFCDLIDAEPYYTVNLQGGTDGRERESRNGEGEAPAEPLDERIKYKHTAPNPCGNTNYTFGTLADTLDFFRKYTIDRALAGKRPLLHYEMGNENWGQSRTDWPPEVYARTVEVYSRAIRGLLDDAKKRHPELAKYQLYIVAVGYPVMGNNMKMVDTPDRDINLRWTRELNKLHSQGVIDAVQEHFYPYGSANGGTLAWVAHNLHNIIHSRLGLPNGRLDGYRDAAIAYNMPMEHTEWNVKCWGAQFKEVPGVSNGGFEDGLSGWTATGGARPAIRAARRGDRGIRAVVERDGKPAGVSRVIDVPQKTKTLVAGVWVRTDKPDTVRIEFRQADDGESKGKVLGGWGSRVADAWERVVASARIPADTKKVEIALRVESPATAYFDEVTLHYTTEERGQTPLSAMTFEQELFCVDALREMALGGCPRAHLHHLAGDYACGAMTSSGEIKDLAKVFQFFAGAYGDSIVEADTVTPSFGYYSAGNPWATDFNALAPDRPDIPMLGCMASTKGNVLCLLLINRTSDRDIRVGIDLGAEPAASTAGVRTLSGTDIDVPGARIEHGEAEVARVFTRTVAPYTAQILTIALKR